MIFISRVGDLVLDTSPIPKFLMNPQPPTISERPMRAIKILTPISVFLLMLIVLAAPTSAQVQVGVVNTRKLATESRLGKAGLEKIKSMGDSLKQEIQRKQEAYQAALNSFRSRAVGMPVEKRAAEEDRLQKQGIELKRAAEDARRDIEREGKKIEEDVQRKVLSGIQEYARQEGYDLVLDHLQCLFNSQATDITEDVLRYLDSRYNS